MKYALIGCGRISPNHIAAALANGLEIVALCDILEENGFFTTTTKGYMFFKEDIDSWIDGELRRGIIRATKL